MIDVESAVARADVIQGWMPQRDLRWLARAAAGKELVLEIGSWRGRSAKAMAGTVGGTLICVDPWWDVCEADRLDKYPSLPPGKDNVYPEFKANLSEEISLGKVHYIRSRSEDAPPFVDKFLNGRKLDMVFIDGGHHYEQVKADIARWTPRLKKGGILSGHDYKCPEWPGVQKAVDEVLPHAMIIRNRRSGW